MLTLAYPWLLLVLPLPWLVQRLAPHREPRQALAVPFLGRLATLTGREPAPGSAIRRGGPWQRIVVIACWALIVLALARPQHLEPPVTRTVPMRDLLLAVDLSQSMETRDLTDAAGQPADRLGVVKQVLDGFLARREGDRVGLILFGSAAFIQAPFTDDLDVVRELLAEARTGMAGPRTVLGDAIGLAITMFDRSQLEDRVLILLTDGNDTGSRVPPAEAAKVAADKGIVVHAVAVGDPQAAGEDKLDAETLRAVAAATGGDYFFAADRASLAQAYARLDELATHETQTLSDRPRAELFQWPLGAALLLSLAYHALTALGSRRRPRTAKASA
jgi:Ca-activated chloride channel family protein